MRVMTAPNYIALDVFQECINSISDIGLRSRLSFIAPNIAVAAEGYRIRALISQLHTLAPNESDNDAIVMGAVTKNELKAVYSSHMVPRAKPARYFYDSILALAPLGRCPFCGFGHASTLDHYLPKSKYPQLSVLPLNLIPCCKDCNLVKLADVVLTQDQQCLHPYFDHTEYINEQWLFAKVVESAPVTVSFHVKPPDHWTDISKSRVQAHFKSFGLGARYAIEASTQLACLRHTLTSYREISGAAAVRQHIAIEANAHFRQHKNAWQTAMFQSLANSDWYCDGGFL
jgi:hypothetical protein